MKNPFYITTTLPYINSDPHIGFAAEILRADVMARYQRALGNEVFFNTGTDEHGQKIWQKAQEAGIDVQEFSDKMTEKFKALKELLDLSYDNYIRTTDANHIKAAQEFWKRCLANDDIYKKNYKIKYCVGCELEKTESELDENGRCPLHPDKDLEIIDEENYFFRFSKYQDKLLELYRNNPEFVRPQKRLNEIVSFVERGVEDFSISRFKEKMPWGVPVPDDDQHVMYVWFDALVNYISALGWPDDQARFEKFWPAVQIAGKDNLRQQSAMWQAMLMSAGLPNSETVFITGFFMVNGQKMSKSLGNVIGPNEMVNKFGIDATRYLLLSLGNFGDDIDVTWERMTEKYNADLANGLGNLVSRVVKLSQKLENVEVDFDKKGALAEMEKYQKDFEAGKAEVLLEEIMKIARQDDKFIEENKPWELAKSDKTKFEEVMKKLLNDLHLIAFLVNPFMPATTSKIRKILETKEFEVLFERIK